MDCRVSSNYSQPTILIISNNKTEIPLSSSILASFDRLQVVFKEQETLSWIQQHQPSLIMLNLEQSERMKLLVTTLKLDWLTRDIPIIAIVDSAARQLCQSADLNYDACLSRPYSDEELEQKVCPLLPNCDCKFYSNPI